MADSPEVVIVRGTDNPDWAPSLGGVARRVLTEAELRSTADEPALRDTLDRASCVFIDGRTSFARVAHRLRELRPDLQLAIVVANDQQAAAQRALLFAPGVGEPRIVTPEEIDDGIVARIEPSVAAAASHPPAPRALASDALLAGLLRVLPDAVFTVDENGRILSANEAAEQLLDDAGSSARDRSLWSLLPPGPLGTNGRPDVEGETTYETKLDGKDGVTSVWQVRVTPIRAGEVRASAVVARDLTGQYRLHRQLEDQAAQLEAQASEMEAQQEELHRRTEAAERAQTTAEMARADADAANTAKSQFLATMSHELRTPLNAIVGYAELLTLEVSGPLNEGQRGYLTRLAASGAHLLGLISDILDLSKIDAGGMTIRSARASTVQTIHAALDLTAAQAAQRGVALSLEEQTTDAPYVGDPDRVRQILLNLLSNAVKFTEPGGRIVIRTAQIEGTAPEARLVGLGPWVRIDVTDTGIGIAPQLQATVFDPFVQVDSRSTRQAGGTGLGLAISRRLARLMGGDLTLESTLGSGSSFTLWLPSLAPAQAGEEEEAPATRAARARRRAAEHRTHGLRDLGMALREELEPMLESFVTRVRADAAFVKERRLPQPLIEDHSLAFLADMAQALVAADHAGEHDPENHDDSEEIQNVIARLHGYQRHRLGWTEQQLVRAYALMMDELTARLQRHEVAASEDVRLASGMIQRLVMHARAVSVTAFREASAART